MIDRLLHKIKQKWMKIRLQPIRVFVFHHVSDVRNPFVCQEADWTQLDQMKQNLERLQEKYTFISLKEACDKLQRDKFRCKKYAVLTTDDGLSSVTNIIPWLEERKISLTLFVNTRYMEGDILKPVHKEWLLQLEPKANTSAIAKLMYLSKEQVWALNSQYIEIALHGHEHLDATLISESAFEKEVRVCNEMLKTHPRYVSAYAYPWGHSTTESLSYLHRIGLIPIVVRGGMNYSWSGTIDRECIDNKKL